MYAYRALLWLRAYELVYTVYVNGRGVATLSLPFSLALSRPPASLSQYLTQSE